MTDIKSILVHLDGSTRAGERLVFADRYAARCGAEVTGLYAVVPTMIAVAAEGGATAISLLAELDEQRYRSAKAMFDHAYARRGAPMLLRETRGGAPIGAMIAESLYHDLIVLSQCEPGDRDGNAVPADFVEAILVGSGRPALVLPYIGSFGGGEAEKFGRVVMVAWKPTRESARAVSAALPMLRQAEKVHVVTWGKDADADAQSLRRYLAQHSVQCQSHAAEKTPEPVGEALLSLAADLGADLLVMGCYGHSRAREWVLGGASRSLLRSMTLPVLMAH